MSVLRRPSLEMMGNEGWLNAQDFTEHEVLLLWTMSSWQIIVAWLYVQSGLKSTVNIHKHSSDSGVS
jgi:hypothetical protein